MGCLGGGWLAGSLAERRGAHQRASKHSRIFSTRFVRSWAGTALAQSHRQDESHLRVVRERGPARARVVTIHDMVPYLFPQLTEERFVEQHRTIVNSIDRERDWIVCNSVRTKTDFCEMTGMSAERVFVTPFAASLEIFRPERDSARIASVRAKHHVGSRPYVLSLGTLEPRKNLARLVRAFFGLVDDGRWPELLLVLVGPTGWKTEGLFASFAEMGCRRLSCPSSPKRCMKQRRFELTRHRC